MARPAGEKTTKIPTAISRPEGGWFARIWSERSENVKQMIRLGRSEPFTVWIESLKNQDSAGTVIGNDGPEKLRNIHAFPSKAFTLWSLPNNDPNANPGEVIVSELVSKSEPLTFSESKAFSIWADDPKKGADRISPLPSQAFTDQEVLEDSVTVEENAPEIKVPPSKGFSIWTTEEAIAEPKLLRLVYAGEDHEEPANEKPMTRNETKESSASTVLQNGFEPNKTQVDVELPDFLPQFDKEVSQATARKPIWSLVALVIMLLLAMVWMFVSAEEMASVKGEMASVKGKMASVKEEMASVKESLTAKEEEISELEKRLIKGRNAAKVASENAKEVAKLQLKKANDRFLEKNEEAKNLTEKQDRLRIDYERAKKSHLDESQKLKVQISALKAMRSEAQAQLDQAQKQRDVLTKTVNSLEKKVSELNVAMLQAAKASKKASDEQLAAIAVATANLKASNEMLKKERSDSVKLRSKLDSSEKQLESLMMEMEALKVKIKDLEKPPKDKPKQDPVQKSA